MNGIHYKEGDSRPLKLSRRYLPVGTCKALNSTNKPCRCYAVKGEVFCRVHLAQGYGLFTLAVMARENVSTLSANRLFTDYPRKHGKENQNGTR